MNDLISSLSYHRQIAKCQQACSIFTLNKQRLSRFILFLAWRIFSSALSQRFDCATCEITKLAHSYDLLP